MEHKIHIAHDASGSRIYDALLESTTVPLKAKRQFVLDFIGHYHELVDDRIGSRVGDRCWASSDTYLKVRRVLLVYQHAPYSSIQKEKVARSLIPFESQLAGSFYGKFFVRNLNLYMLQRRPDEWRNVQTQRRQQALQQQQQIKETPSTAPQEVASTSTVAAVVESKSRKRSKPSDEIEELFDKTLGKKIKKAALATEETKEVEVSKPAADAEKKSKKGKDKDKKKDNSLDAVLGAIKSAPKHDSERPKKKHKKA